MTKRNKKASRNDNLIVFSHEHHHGLIFCNRLKKAAHIDDETVSRYIIDFWDNYLDLHFKNEEIGFLPHLVKEGLTLQFINEHKQINKLVDEIKSGKGKIKAQALALSKLIHDHIRFEEREFFPWLEKELTDNQLESIGLLLNDTEVSAHDFSPAFWI
mgnify:CR=1 FL=1|tara:strand:+ start:13462 stop:13935 length:474 start_codon:yes stop_codon:yes gene_type:complete